MTRIIITLLASILSLLLNAQEAQQEPVILDAGITITVNIEKISSNKGKVYFSLFNSKESFYERTPINTAIGSIDDSKTQIVFLNVSKGSYAITCFHDANDNKNMDFDGYMPVEDYGASNNSRSMGPPQFEPAKFEVQETDIDMIIKF